VSYGVQKDYGAAVLELIRSMPPSVGSNYFQFVDNNFKPLSIGTVIHAPMVPLFGAGRGDRQIDWLASKRRRRILWHRQCRKLGHQNWQVGTHRGLTTS
jgi:hypothetical protein